MRRMAHQCAIVAQAGRTIAKVEERWFGEPAVCFLLEQIEIVQPRVIVALGQQAYDCVLRVYDLPERRGAFRETVMVLGLALPTAMLTTLVGVYHCGNGSRHDSPTQ